MAGYGTDEAFQTWATDNGYTVPAGTVAAARLRGSVYIDGAYGSRFPGRPTGGVDQEREWPRTGATDRYGNALPSDEVPLRIEHAAYHAALIELQTPGFFSKTYTASERKVLTEVKGIKWTVVGSAKGEMAEVPVSTTIAGMLAPLLLPEHAPAILVV